MKKILVIGGTQFVGRNLMEAFIENGNYNITMFNRGITNPELFPEIKRIKGDRKNEDDLRKICSIDWDCVIDISGYWPDALEKQFELQTGKIGKYIFISTSSHYQFDLENPHLIKEEEEIVPCTLEQRAGSGFKFYNERKAECERVLANQKDLNYVILRPGLIIGKYDHTDRLYYWFYKMKTQKEILVAEGERNLVSYTVVKDLSKMIMQSMENNNHFKVYNASSFNASILDFLFLLKKEMDKEVEFVAGSADFLKENEVQHWIGLPLWLDGEILVIDNSRIEKDYNFIFTKIEKVTSDLIKYYSEYKKWENPDLKQAPISDEKEKELILKLRQVG